MLVSLIIFKKSFYFSLRLVGEILRSVPAFGMFLLHQELSCVGRDLLKIKLEFMFESFLLVEVRLLEYGLSMPH